MHSGALDAVWLIVWPFVPSAQTPSVSPSDALRDVLVWGTDTSVVDPHAYAPAVRSELEWEGYHDCPEREAVFASTYQAAHPGGPFREFPPLLAAHRWLCTAEGYEYEKRPEDAARSRRAYEQAISTARRSTSLLARAAAEGLTARGRCPSER